MTLCRGTQRHGARLACGQQEICLLSKTRHERGFASQCRESRTHVAGSVPMLMRLAGHLNMNMHVNFPLATGYLQKNWLPSRGLARLPWLYSCTCTGTTYTTTEPVCGSKRPGLRALLPFISYICYVGEERDRQMSGNVFSLLFTKWEAKQFLWFFTVCCSLRTVGGGGQKVNLWKRLQKSGSVLVFPELHALDVALRPCLDFYRVCC